MQSVQTSRVLMLCAVIMVILSPASSQPIHPLPLQLQPQLHHPLLQRTRSAAALLPEEWKKRAVEDLLSQLSLRAGDTAQREAEVVSMGAEEGETVAMVTDVEAGVAKESERSVEGGAPNSLPPRERKAGCKNFYWKGFTSC